MKLNHLFLRMCGEASFQLCCGFDAAVYSSRRLQDTDHGGAEFVVTRRRGTAARISASIGELWAVSDEGKSTKCDAADDQYRQDELSEDRSELISCERSHRVRDLVCE